MPLLHSINTTDNEQPQFPETAWIGEIAEYYNLICDTTEAPDELIWGAIVSVLASLAALCIRLPWGTGFMRPILFLCLLGETSRTRKTTAMTDAVDTVLDPLRPRGTQPGEPDPFEIVRGQGSGEGLLDILADRQWRPPGANNTTPPNVQTGRAALFMFDEFGALVEKSARDHAGNLHGFLLQLFDSPSQMQLTTRSKVTVCTNAHGSILAASTPDFLAKGLTESMVHSGFVNRFFFLAGKRTSPIPHRPPIDANARQALLDRVRGHMQALRGTEMTMSPEARAVNESKYIADFHRTEESSLVEAATDRGSTLAIRIAMVFAFAEGSPIITGHHMNAAWDLVQYSRRVVCRLLGLMTSKDFEHAEKK
ncbi:MAG TPA: DUF3987 domain-containing protein, partial [Gemmatimonadaceae bacterium]|nr:DUF3987 domain-containing protein [Gemmatimonadaceae bacterium]